MAKDVATTEWTTVDLGDVELRGVFWGWDRAWVHGYRRPVDQLVPYVATVRDDGSIAEYDLPVRGRLTSACSLGTEVGLCIGESPVELLLLDDVQQGVRHVERDESFLSAVRAWVTMGDEDPFYVAEWEDGRLTAGEPWHEDFPEVTTLRRTGTDDGLIVGSSDGAPYVAGRLASGDDPASVGLWSCSDDMGLYGPGGWQRQELELAPDGFTQITRSSSPEFAGHLDGRPVLFGGRRELRLLDVPDVPLDADHPQVLVPWGATTLALQSRDEGPQLWTRTENGWSPHSLPPGRLNDAAVCTTSGLVWVIVDGRLWRPIA